MMEEVSSPEEARVEEGEEEREDEEGLGGDTERVSNVVVRFFVAENFCSSSSSSLSIS